MQTWNQQSCWTSSGFPDTGLRWKTQGSTGYFHIDTGPGAIGLRWGFWDWSIHQFQYDGFWLLKLADLVAADVFVSSFQKSFWRHFRKFHLCFRKSRAWLCIQLHNLQRWCLDRLFLFQLQTSLFVIQYFGIGPCRALTYYISHLAKKRKIIFKVVFWEGIC